MLKNFQVALMKPYFDMGLRELARVAGYPVAAIQSCSQFKRTHNFIIEVWQAVYLVMLQRFIDANIQQSNSSPHFTDIVQNACLHIKSSNFVAKLNELREQLQQSSYHDKFKSFLDTMASQDPNWKFWKQFIFEDGLAYIALFLAIRSGNWELRLASIKLMAAVFTAFDHQTYRKLIAQHLADLCTFPGDIIDSFKQGGFVVSLSGKQWHSVAVDEAHEMKINKECKTSIIQPSQDYINRIASYIPYRAKCMENLREQLFPEVNHTTYNVPNAPNSIVCEDYRAKRSTANIIAQRNLMLSVEYLPLEITNMILCNPFKKKVATSDQQHDMLQFRSIGQDEFDRHVAYYILKGASTNPPLRKKRLLTLSQKKATRRQVTQLEKDRRVVQKCLHKKLKWSKHTGRLIDKIHEQYIPLPLALAESNGMPIKGQKSNTTKALKARYKDASPPVFLNSLPETWTPECVMVEGMFMLNTIPLCSHRTFADYANFLSQRFLTPHFTNGAREVHLIFDNPGRL